MTAKIEPQTADLNADGKAPGTEETAPANKRPGHPQPSEDGKIPESGADAVDRARDSLESTLAGLKLTPEEEDEFSAIRHLDRLRCPITIAYGSKESPEFQRQGRTVAQALRARGAPAQELILDGLNHFEGIRSMIEPQSPLAQRVLGQLGLAPA